MKKVLIIAHSFPPSGIVGALRPFKFAKYLPDFGWKPIILSVKIGRHVKGIDKSLLDQLKPYVKIHRISEIDPRGLYEKYLTRKNNSQSKIIETYNNLSGGNGFISYLKIFWETWIEIPDRHIGWFPFALFKALRIMRNQNIDVIYSTSSPQTSHLVALFIKKITKKPWLADFRDPWTQYPLYKYNSAIRKKINEKFEYRFLQNADMITVTSNLTANGFVDKYPAIPREKIITITNGYDPSDYKDIVKSTNKRKFIITYTGNYFSVSSSNQFIRAVAEMIKLYPDLKSKILVRFIGLLLDDKSKSIINRFNLLDNIQYLGYKSYKQSLQYQSETDILLLTRSNEPGNEVIIPAKLFEYLAIKKPILALVPINGEAANLIRKSRAGIIVSPDNKAEISEAILEMYEKFKNGCLFVEGDNTIIERYDRKRLTGQLAELFNRCSS